MKAVICPICIGTGNIDKIRDYCSTHPTCNGCGGSGWVSVPEDNTCFINGEPYFNSLKKQYD